METLLNSYQILSHQFYFILHLWYDYVMTHKEWIESITIFAFYAENGGDSHLEVYAEHDEIFLGPNPEIVSPKHLKRLDELGWLESDGCFQRFA